MVTINDYPRREVEAARSVLVELWHMLGSYRNDLVIVGGWVPELLFPASPLPHVGSLDVDIALNHRTLKSSGYQSIQQLLLGRGYYQPQNGQRFQYFRDVPIEDGSVLTIQIDFLAGEYGGRKAGTRHQRVVDMWARKARGCDLAFDAPLQVAVAGVLPGGGLDTVIVRVADMTAFIAMKAHALSDRLKEKDAWDIYYCIQGQEGGNAALAEQIRPRLGHGLVREGLSKLSEQFASIDRFGPTAVANFEDLPDRESREIRRRDAFERVQDLLRRLDVV